MQKTENRELRQEHHGDSCLDARMTASATAHAVESGCRCIGGCCSGAKEIAASVVETAALDGASLLNSSFIIAGLDCADCAAKLEKRIAAMPGVRVASINFGAGKLVVVHALTDTDIIKTVKQAGYDAISENAETKSLPDKQRWWQNVRTVATLLSGLFLIIAAIFDLAGPGKDYAVPFYALSMAVGGYHVVKSGLYGLKTLTLDTNFLMTIAVIGAVAIGEWSEGATVVFLFSLGNALQSYTMDKTRESIRSLMKLSPREALVRRNGSEVRLPVEQIRVGDIILVKSGERIALDGKVAAGVSTVNQAPITGESIPVEKKAGDVVYAGTVNEHGALEIEVTKLAADSTLAKIMHLVEEAQAERAPMQQFVDVFAKYYTPLVIIGAIALTLLPWMVFNQPFSTWFYRSLVLLVISCPCALVISTPVSIVSAIGNASRNGVLIKGGIHLEQMGTIEAVAFDKTGTLTQGKPVVTEIETLASISKEELLILAASIEKWSEHPLAKAVAAKAAGMELFPVCNFKALVGRGACADVEGQTVYIGNARLFEELGLNLAPYAHKIAVYEEQGKTVMLIGSKELIIGLIAVADTVRDNSKDAVTALKAAGVKSVVMLTGDNNQVAKAIAEKINVDSFYSELLPEDKVSVLKRLAQKHGSVAMAGDGVNDAPALAAANVGIAMGVAGSDTALETADIALMSDDLTKLPYVMKLSRKTVRIIRQNIIFSLAIKAVFVLAAFGGFVNLWLAVFADTGAALLVTLNGMRLMREIR